MSKRILIVEDDRSLSDVLAYNLKQQGYEVQTAYDGQDGLDQARLKIPDLILLDVMLPILDGHEVCRRLRADSSTKDIMIIMLTARSEESDQIVGFPSGADDYVTKPFKVKVLIERIKAVWRRTRATEATDDEIVASQGVELDRVRHQVSIQGKRVHLTRSEFRLLETLLRQPGRVFQRSELIDAALGEDTLVLERTIDVHIRALRQKMGESSELIETVRGVGYRFRDPVADDAALSR